MKLTVTLREVLDAGKWEKFCEMKGFNPWCMNEGQASGDDEVTLTEEEAEQLGLLPKEKWPDPNGRFGW